MEWFIAPQYSFFAFGRVVWNLKQYVRFRFLFTNSLWFLTFHFHLTDRQPTLFPQYLLPENEEANLENFFLQQPLCQMKASDLYFYVVRKLGKTKPFSENFSNHWAYLKDFALNEPWSLCQLGHSHFVSCFIGTTLFVFARHFEEKNNIFIMASWKCHREKLQ